MKSSTRRGKQKVESAGVECFHASGINATIEGRLKGGRTYLLLRPSSNVLCLHNAYIIRIDLIRRARDPEGTFPEGLRTNG